MERPFRSTCAPICSALLLSAALSASAASTWTGGGTTANLSDGGNWGGTAPTPGASTVLNFAGSLQTSPVNDFAANSAFGAWVLNSGASAFSVSGNAINLAIGFTNNSSSLFSIGVPVTATASLWARAISGDITFSSPIALGTYNITLTGTGHTLTFANGAGLSGTGTFTLSTGTLDLNFGSGNFTNSAKFAISPNTGITNTVNFRSGTAYFVEQNFFTLAGSPGTAILNVLGGTLNINHAGSGQRFMIGSQGTGIVNVNGGTLAIGTTTGTIELGGDNQYSGNNATGILNINAGSTMTVGKNTTYGFELGRNTSGKTGANGILNLFGTLATARNVVGADGTSTLLFSGGTLKALSGASTLLTNITTALVSTNGAIIDDGGIAVTIAQNLQHDYNVTGADGGLTKQGSSTVTLAKDNTYTGPTIISGGKLVGVVGTSLPSSAVTVNDTAGCTLGVSITSSSQQWSCAGLTFAGNNAGLDFNFGATAPSTFVAPIQVTGDVNFTGTPVVTLESTALPAGPGTYPLLTWTGNMSGTPPTTTTLPNHAVGTLSVVGNTLQLNITAAVTQPMTWAAGTGIWDINSTPNWQDASGQTSLTFLQGDTVVFDDTPTGTGPFTVSLDSAVTPATTTVNATKDYTISGTGSIGGGTLTKKGTGTLSLSTSNSYSSTVVQGGTVAISADNNLGVSTGGLTLSSATLHTTASLTSGRSVTFSGSDDIQADPGTALTLTTGTLTLNNTILDVNPTSGGSLFVNGKVVLANASSSSVTNNLWSGSLNLTNTQPFVMGDGSATATAVLNLLGGTLNLGQAGGNQHLMLGNMGLGIVNINGGALVVSGGSGTVSVGGDPIWSKNNASGTITLNSGSMTVSNGILMQLGMNNPTNSGAKGYLNLFGGTLTTSGVIGGGNGNGYVLFSGGTLKAGANLSAWLTNLTSVAVSTNGAILDDGGYAVAVSQPLVHDANVTGADGGLTKNGSGSLTLSGANTYSGPSTVTAGCLLVNGIHAGGASYSVANGATLGGNGTIDLSAVNGNVTVSSGGKVSPGSAAATAGTLTLALGTGSLDLSAAAATPGALLFDLAAPGASDNVTLSSGSLNIGNGVLNFASFAFNNVSAVPGTYTLIHSTSPIVGTLAASGLSGGVGTLSGTLSLSGNDIVLTTVSAPPSVTLTAPLLVGSQFAFTFPTVSGFSYQVQSATNLTPPIVWTPVGSAVPGTGAAVGVTNAATGQSTFFRVKIQ